MNLLTTRAPKMGRGWHEELVRSRFECLSASRHVRGRLVVLSIRATNGQESLLLSGGRITPAVLERVEQDFGLEGIRVGVRPIFGGSVLVTIQPPAKPTPWRVRGRWLEKQHQAFSERQQPAEGQGESQDHG